MRRVGNKPWWHNLEHVCRLCGGGFTLEADDHVRDSLSKRDREHGTTGSLGTRWSGLVDCPYCKQIQHIMKFSE